MKINFNNLTNKFEEINFKLDKLSNRMSKVQADNQIRFQDLENSLSSDRRINKKITKKKKKNEKFYLEVHQPQDLGSISYKDTKQMKLHNKLNLLIQQLQLLQKLFKLKKKFYQKKLLKNNMNLQQVF